MPRHPRPWRRSGRNNDWYAQVNGKKVFLLPADATESAATRQLNEILGIADKGGAPDGGKEPEKRDPTVGDVIEFFLEDVESRVRRKELEPVTQEGYERYLAPITRKPLGEVKVGNLRPYHVQEWIDGNDAWKATSRHNAATAVKAAFNWAVGAGVIESNPIASLKKPKAERREKILTDGQVRAIIAETKDREFRDLIAMIAMTGARPSQVYGLTADDVNLADGTITVRNKTHRKTGVRKAVIFLNEAAAEILKPLVEKYREGPLFRNTHGNPWTRYAVACRMARLADKLGMDEEACLYSLRHLYITNALEAGVQPATLAALVGHTDITMIMRVYNKLAQRTQHLKDAARLVPSPLAKKGS